MIPLSVCLETVFTDRPLAERIHQIADAGYRHIEFWHPEGTFDGQQVRVDEPKEAAVLREACDQNALTVNDFAFNAWDGSFGGSPVRSADLEKYLAQVRRMIAFAQSIGCRHGITLSGVVDPALTRSQMRSNFEQALAAAAKLALEADLTLLLEPLNTLVDHPGYYLHHFGEAAEIVRSVGSPNLRLLYDVYHMQIMEGNVLATVERHFDLIGHFHSAGVPGRGELFGGELDYPNILRHLEKLGYEGCFGLEYFPRSSDHAESLKRIRAYLRQD